MPSPLRDLVKLARPKQWAKSAFVIVGPVYGMAFREPGAILAVLGIVFAFNFASSACYILNDLRDVESDRLHPRKKNRPIASGRISPASAMRFGLFLFALAALCLVPVFFGSGGERAGILATATVLAYVANVICYTGYLKHRPVIDVLSLAMGFVLRVLGGCAAVLVEPSSWLLNCTLFIAMFLALGKRLGERRTMGEAAANVRGVQASYTDDTLRMLVVMTAIACLLSYSDYVQAQAHLYLKGFNLLWLTLIPATYAIFRAVLLLERGIYDDPTELATRDRPFQGAVLAFALITGALMFMRNQHLIGDSQRAPRHASPLQEEAAESGLRSPS